MRFSRYGSGRALCAAAVLALSCSGAAPAPSSPETGPEGPAGAFDAERAWAHLEALVGVGPRPAGSDGAEAARTYIRERLEALELEVEARPFEPDLGAEVPAPELVNLVAVLPGESTDRIVLAAPYDTRHFESFDFVGANDGASGAALLLELARVLTLRPLHYTVELLFLEGEAPRRWAGPESGETRLLGSAEMALRWAEDERLRDVRLLVLLNRVCDPDLRIARDLNSHRFSRDAFWRAAERLGYTDAFRPSAPFESPVAGHRPFVAVGLRRAVALLDTVHGGEEAPGLYDGTEDDDLAHCASSSLESVGHVAVEALHTLSRRLAKIDRFARSPLESEVETEDVPPASEVGPPEAESSGADPAGVAAGATGDEGGPAPPQAEAAQAPPVESASGPEEAAP